MRLFTGISIPDDVLAALTRLIEHLRTKGALRWTSPYNLHITTKFIGEWPESRLTDLVNAFECMHPAPPFEIGIRGFGWFPNPHHPRVLWVGVDGSDALRNLAKATDETTAALGVPREDKPYSPHLTLARIKEPIPLGPLRQAIADLKSDNFGRFPVERWKLYRSTPGPAGSIYTQLAEFPLTGK